MSDASLTHLHEAMREAGLNDQALGDAVGATKQEIWRFRTGKRPLNQAWAKKLAPVLKWDWPHLIDGRPNSVSVRSASILAQRIEAARLAAWGEHYDLAARDTGIPSERLIAVEQGDLQPDAEFMVAFSRASKVPLGWFAEGAIEGMPVEAVARIAHYRPHLLRALLQDGEA